MKTITLSYSLFAITLGLFTPACSNPTEPVAGPTVITTAEATTTGDIIADEDSGADAGWGPEGEMCAKGAQNLPFAGQPCTKIGEQVCGRDGQRTQLPDYIDPKNPLTHGYEARYCHRSTILTCKKASNGDLVWVAASCAAVFSEISSISLPSSRFTCQQGSRGARCCPTLSARGACAEHLEGVASCPKGQCKYMNDGLAWMSDVGRSGYKQYGGDAAIGDCLAWVQMMRCTEDPKPHLKNCRLTPELLGPKRGEFPPKPCGPVPTKCVQDSPTKIRCAKTCEEAGFKPCPYD